MAVQLESLRVFAEMDATKYVAGMNQKIAADKAGTASSTQVGAAVQATDNKLSVAGNAANRLARQYVDGFASAQRFSSAIGSLGRAIETGNVTMEQADVILAGIYRKYGLMANAAELAEAGNLSLAASVTALNTRLAAQEAQADGTAMAMNRLGAANDNVGWQTRNLRFQLFDVAQMLALGQNPMMTLLQQGPQIAQIYGPEEGGVGRAFRETGRMITGVLTKFPMLTAAAAAAAIGFAGLTYEINQSTDVSVGFGDVILATFQVIRDGVASILAPAFAAIAPYAQTAWDAILAGVKLVGNTIINSFRAAFEDLKLVFTQFPNIVATGVAGAANAVVAGIETMINYAVQGLDWLIEKVNALPDWIKPGSFEDIGKIGSVSLGRVDAGTAGQELSDAVAKRNAAVAGIMGSDPLGEFFDQVKDQSIINALNGQKDAADGAASAYERLREQQIGRLGALQQSLMTEEEAARNSFANQLLDIEEFYQAKLISEADYYDLSARAREEYETKIDDLRQQRVSKEFNDRMDMYSSVADTLSSISSIIESSGDKNLAASKAFGIASALINTYVGVSQAFADPTLTTFAKFAAAAAVMASGLAQVASIRSVNKGGGGGRGGSVGAAGGGTSQAGNAQNSRPTQAVTINLSGERYSRESVEALLERINEATADGHKLVVRAA